MILFFVACRSPLSSCGVMLLSAPVYLCDLDPLYTLIYRVGGAVQCPVSGLYEIMFLVPVLQDTGCVAGPKD